MKKLTLHVSLFMLLVCAVHAQIKVSELPTASSASTSDYSLIVQSGTTKRATLLQILNAASGIYQPLDSDLTAIAALTTTSAGRSLLTSGTLTAAGLGLTNGATIDAWGAISTASKLNATSGTATGLTLAGTTSGTLTLNSLAFTGSLPGANVQASGTGNAGVTFVATDAEVQTGTNALKTVPPSGLAAWWTWIKTQAQTIAGNWSYGGNLTAGDAAADEFVANDDDPRAPNLTAATYTAAADDKVLLNGAAADGRYRNYPSLAISNIIGFTLDGGPYVYQVGAGNVTVATAAIGSGTNSYIATYTTARGVSSSSARINILTTTPGSTTSRLISYIFIRASGGVGGVVATGTVGTGAYLGTLSIPTVTATIDTQYNPVTKINVTYSGTTADYIVSTIGVEEL